tara:strand:- start:91 stop:996 length:906 start_codon:yes stop_codon:yes gene_type:complete
MIKAGMTVTEAIAQLTRGFIKMMGRNPDGLEKIKIKQEAVEKLKDLEKVVDLEGNVIDTSKGIMGGQQIGMFDNIFNKMRKQMGKGDPKIVKPDPEKKSMGGRIGLKDGPDLSKRNFMKILGGLAAIPVFGKFFRQADKVAPAAEKVAEVAGQAPSYFFDLVAKIKLLGQPRRTPSYKERVNEYQYTGKDGIEYELIEDLDTGEIMIQKDKIGVGSSGDKSFDVITDRTEMRYKKGQADETTGGTPADDYEEYKVEFDSDGTFADATEIDEISKMEIMKEITDEAPPIKKAGGGLAYMLGE